MPSKPRTSLLDSYIEGKRCAICGRPALKVMHNANLPDFVVCSGCESAFVVEDDGERVMYGKISEEYPQTAQFALRQWAWLEAVDRKATTERSPADTRAGQAVPLDTRPDPPTPPAQAPLDTGPDPIAIPTPLDTGPEKLPPMPEPAETPEADQPAPAHFPFDEAVTAPPDDLDVPSFESSPSRPFGDEILGPEAIQRPPKKPAPGLIDAEHGMDQTGVEEVSGYKPPAGDPPAGTRYRLALKGAHVRIPTNFCAHCGATPVRSKLAVSGTLPKGQSLGQRVPTVFHIPLCASCTKRASRKGPEEKGARLQAFLVSTLIALVLLVASLAWGIIDFQTRPLPSAIITIIFAALGFTIPTYLQLSRIKGYPLPPDAAYVQSTLLVPRETQGLETAFEWRNERYAEIFAKANESAALGNMIKVKDRTSQR